MAGTPNSTEQNPRTRKSAKEQLEQLRKEHPERFQQVEAGTQADAERATQNVAIEKPEREIPDKTFQTTPFSMSGVTGYVAILTMQDVADYCAYAEDLYSEDEATELMARWQRKHESGRVSAARDYLTSKPIHFFPPLILICTDGASIAGDGIVTAKAHSFGVLDGQHRYGGIREALELKPELADETIPVVILDVADLETRQQIFSDVNKTPKKVSKSLTIAFDHSDPVSRMVQHLIRIPNENGLRKVSALFDEERPKPKASEPVIMSTVNLKNLLRPDDKKASVIVDRFNESVCQQMLSAIIDNLPFSSELKQGIKTFGDVSKIYTCYSGTLWQAVGVVLNEEANRKNDDGSYQHDADQFVARVRSLFQRMRDTDGWSVNNARWLDPDGPVVVAGKVETKREYVDRACKVLRDVLSKVE